MKILEVYNQKDMATVFFKTNMTEEQFDQETYEFLCNSFKSNEGLTVQLFAEKMQEKGYECECIVPTHSQYFAWWGDSFKGDESENKAKLCNTCGNELGEGIPHEIKGMICKRCYEYFKNQK